MARHSRTLWPVLPLMLAAASTHAQPVAQPDGRWRVWLNTGLTHTAGNTSSTTLTLKSDLVRATPDDKWTLYGEALSARSEGVTSGNRARLGGRYDWNLSPRTFSFGSLDLERDTLAELDRRVAAGAGLGYKLVDRTDLRFSVFGGLSHTADRYSVPRTVDGEVRTRFDRPAALLGEESGHKLSATTSINQRLVVNTDLDAQRAHRAQWDGNLSVAMTDSISLTIGLNVRYDSAPAAGLKHTDTLLTTGIAMKFE
jgi:putative salt-induced outer membrane protein